MFFNFKGLAAVASSAAAVGLPAGRGIRSCRLQLCLLCRVRSVTVCFDLGCVLQSAGQCRWQMEGDTARAWLQVLASCLLCSFTLAGMLAGIVNTQSDDVTAELADMLAQAPRQGSSVIHISHVGCLHC